MQNKQKTLNLLGLAQKAGKLATGFDAVKISLSKNQAKLIFIGNDVSQNTKDKLNFLIRKKDVKLVDTFSSAEITQALGKERKFCYGFRFQQSNDKEFKRRSVI